MTIHPVVLEIPAPDAPDARPVWSGVPAHLRAGLWRYLSQRIRTGGFLEAVLRNDLADAVCRADPALSLTELKAIVLFLRTYAPSSAWGSPEAVEAWLAPPEEE